MSRFITVTVTVGPQAAAMPVKNRVCFFVLCKRHWINRVPGFPVYTLHLNSDAGYAVVPLTLLGAPVSIGEALGGLMA